VTTQDVDFDATLEDLLFHQARRHRDEILQFQDALARSRQVNMAIGIVMGQEGLDPDDALELLTMAGDRAGRPLGDVAAEVAETGRLVF
jgi:AmiR/NasT family two-component response regulator